MSSTLQIAIVGGGLCGLALALALEKRSIDYRIYEARSSFTEIGAGINLGPNTIAAFKCIDEELGEQVIRLATRNPPGKEHVYLQVRFGAPIGKYGDRELITELMAPPTGSMTFHRKELLQLLASQLPEKRAVFNKKLASIDDIDSGVTLHFADGSQEAASVVIACDGAHSAVRTAMVGESNKAASTQYAEYGLYRAVVPMETISKSIGFDAARTSQILVGTDSYVITYPIAGAEHVNIGLWQRRPGTWPHREWIIPSQREQMVQQFQGWGETVNKIMDLIPDPSFYSTHYHGIQPDSMFKGRVCLIGDAAHSMPPHHGAGAGQAIEDAFVMTEVLHRVASQGGASPAYIDAAFHAFEQVRKPRSQHILETSQDAMNLWSDLYKPDLTDETLSKFVREVNSRFQWIWRGDVVGQAKCALEAMNQILFTETQANGHA